MSGRTSTTSSDRIESRSQDAAREAPEKRGLRPERRPSAAQLGHGRSSGGLDMYRVRLNVDPDAFTASSDFGFDGKRHLRLAQRGQLTRSSQKSPTRSRCTK